MLKNKASLVHKNNASYQWTQCKNYTYFNSLRLCKLIRFEIGVLLIMQELIVNKNTHFQKKVHLLTKLILLTT